MVDIGHGINSIRVCLEEAASKIKRSMNSSLEYLQPKHVAKRKRTSEQEGGLSEKDNEDAMKEPVPCQDSMGANLLREQRKYGLLIATLAASVTCISLSRPGSSWSDNDDLLRWAPYLRFYEFFCTFVAMIFMPFVVIVHGICVHQCLLGRRRWWLCTLQAAAVVLDKFIIMARYAISACRTIAIPAFFARHGDEKAASEAPETPEGVRRRLVTFAALVAAVTCQACLSTPDALLWDSQTGFGNQAFFYCNATAFMASLVTIVLLLLNNICRTPGIRNGADAGQIGARAIGSCSESAEPAVEDEADPSRPTIKPKNPREATWRVACAAPHHMTGNQSLLLDCVRVGDDGTAVVNSAGNGEAMPLRVCGSGSVRTESIVLDDVWYVPGLDSNLVSIGQLAQQGCAVSLGPGGCRVTRCGAMVGTARFTEECQFELDFLKVA